MVQTLAALVSWGSEDKPGNDDQNHSQHTHKPRCRAYKGKFNREHSETSYRAHSDVLKLRVEI